MPRFVPAPPPKGTRHPGAGRKPGQPNKISVEARELASQLINDPVYQHKLREDFKLRRVHPTIESMLWAYHLGKPKAQLDVSLTGSIDVFAQIEQERQAFAMLDLGQMAAFAAESQAMTDRLLAASRAQLGEDTPQDVVVEGQTPDMESKTLGKVAESDNGSSVTLESAEDSPPVSDEQAEG